MIPEKKQDSQEIMNVLLISLCRGVFWVLGASVLLLKRGLRRKESSVQ
jgi:hypothetical protein